MIRLTLVAWAAWAAGVCAADGPDAKAPRKDVGAGDFGTDEGEAAPGKIVWAKSSRVRPIILMGKSQGNCNSDSFSSGCSIAEITAKLICNLETRDAGAETPVPVYRGRRACRQAA